MFRRRCQSYILFSHLILLLAFGAEIGYGLLFDPCWDNCQTQMVNFCRVGGDLAQMTDCGCREGKGRECIGGMGACLVICEQAVCNSGIRWFATGRLPERGRGGKRLSPIPSLRSAGRLDFGKRARALCRL